MKKDISAKGLALALEMTEHAKTKLALDEARREMGDLLENLDLASLNRSLDEARAQLEAVTRERDDLEAERDDLEADLEALKASYDGLLDERRLVVLELGCGLQVPLPGRLADVAKHYVSQVREGEARLTRERDEARESEARMRAALERVGRGPCYDHCETRGDRAHMREMWVVAALQTVRAALSARAPEPSERMMRVAEAVRTECGSAASDDRASDLRASIGRLDLRAIVAKVTP